MESSTTPASATTANSSSTPISWSGTFPHHYDVNLGPFIFGPYARNLVNRIDFTDVDNVLELACGTGQVTTLLADRLPTSVQLIATDLSPDMMRIAQAKLSNSTVQWAMVDMTAIPYESDTFDRVVCQFGIMFAPDKAQAFSEIYRVLKPGGRLFFNTWGPAAHNAVFAVFNDVLIRRMNIDMSTAEQGPFSMPDPQVVLQYLENAGFRNCQVDSVAMTGEAESAHQAATGFFQGSVLSVTLQEKNPALAASLQTEIEQALRQQLGDKPMRTPLQAWVFEATK